nr:glutamate ABC transporter substrate-binding protein [Kibdelosporangium sp. MJ126-NF4]CEL13952.1 probable ABC glutamine transporter, substrate binding component [Kibdelosporangium sp. MJ126-NF4]CTQ88321.1 Glutamine ABC transporter, periplasmic glutamine-binding protein (TC 3.A.1.3.2) [Kibdelosporangium sp. MJ126-NF4]
MRALLVVLVLTLGLVAACGQAPQTIPRRPPLSIAEPVPPGMAPVASSTPRPVPPECGPGFNPRAISLRPYAPHPKPGAMPPGSLMDKIVQRGRLIAGVDQNVQLISSRNPRTGELEGFDVDVVRQIAKGLFGDETKVQLRAVNFSDNFAVLNSGDVDILVDSLTITCERRYGLKVWFSTDYFDAGQRIMVQKRSPYQSIEDLGGKRVCAPANTTSIRTIQSYPTLVPVAVADFSDCLVLLQQGQIEAVSSTDGVMLGMVRQDPTLVLRGPRITDEPHGIAIRDRDQDMVRFVNGVLEQMRQDGTWRVLYKKWLDGLDGAGVVPNLPVAQYLEGS